MDTIWRIELLGWLRATRGDIVVSRFRTQKTAVLLAYLAFYRHRSHPREVLIELLWPENEPPAGSQSLRKALSSLRHQLEPPDVPPGGVIRADHQTVQLNPAAVTTDVAEFEAALQAAARAQAPDERRRRLIQATQLYRGELLPGYYADWIVPERQRVAEAHQQALRRLIQLLEQMGDLPGALQWARRAVAADTLSEEAHASLIRLLTATGQMEAAARQYRELERLLAEQLGATPSPEVQQLARDLKRRDVDAREARGGTGVKSADCAWGSGLRASDGSLGTDNLVGERPSSLTAQGPAPDRSIIGRLPLQFTRFFGREEEVARLTALLHPRERQLVTLTGPGGSGKTRLAIEAARPLREPYQQALWFVPLLDLADPKLIIDRVLQTLRLSRSPEIEPLEQVADFLSRQPSLLLLDNFEHLLGDGAEWVQRLRERVETLSLLVTSRQRLGLPGEREFPVPPLPVPVVSGQWSVVGKDGTSGLTTDHRPLTTVSNCPSVQLLVDRSQRVRADFQLTRANAGAIAQLCRQLEGLPLALELAAARANVLTPRQMLSRLSERFELLVTRQRNTDARHRSLRAALDWSYQLLPSDLQQFFAQLSVFRGGWTLEAAAAVCSGDGVRCSVFGVRIEAAPPTPNTDHPTPTLDCLEQLRECSLVQPEEVGGELRFRLLETLREYGAEQLGAEERTAVAHRHASYYLALAERAERELKRADQIAWLDRLERELDNLRAALSWLEASGRIQEALRLGGALYGFWEMRGHPAEGLARLRGLLALPNAAARTSARAKALNSAGILVGALGENEASVSLHEESLTIARQRGDRWNIALALTSMAARLTYLGRQEAARPRFEEALKIWQEIDDPWGITCTLTGLGLASTDQRDYGDTSAILKQCLALRRQLGDQWGVAFVLFRLGSLARDAGDHGEARSLWQEALAVAQEVGNTSLICLSLMGLGQLSYLEGDLPTARALLEQSLPLAREAGIKRTMGELLIHLAEVAVDRGDLDAASACLEEALVFCRLMEDKTQIALSLRTQGRIAQRRGDLVVAGRCFAESLAMRQTSRDTRGISHCLEDMAELALVRRHEERAARLLGAAAALREETGIPRSPVERAEYDRRLDAVRSALGEAEFAAAWSAGRAMPAQQAIAEAVLEAPAG